jgi:hypothetical protein
MERCELVSVLMVPSSRDSEQLAGHGSMPLLPIAQVFTNDVHGGMLSPWTHESMNNLYLQNLSDGDVVE